MRHAIYAAAAAAIVSGAQAAARDAAADPKPSNLLGFDPDYVRILNADDVVPEVRVLSEDDFKTQEVVDFVEAYVPEGVHNSIAEKRYINGNDDRYVYSSTDYPYGAVGKLYWSNGVWCSGTLIGPRHVLTAKHCLTDGASGTFAPGFDNGARLGSGQVTLAVTTGYEWGTPCGWRGDWAILILDTRLGDQRGYFGAKAPDASKKEQNIFTHVGYPGDRENGNRPLRTDGNRILGDRAWDCDSDGPYYTDTDCAGGQSGGPHWENVDGGAYAWGTLSVTFGAGTTAWAGWGSGNSMIETINNLRNEYP